MVAGVDTGKRRGDVGFTFGGEAEPLRHELGPLVERLAVGSVGGCRIEVRPILSAQVWHIHGAEDLHNITGNRGHGSIDAVELLPQRVHPRDRVVRWQLEDDASPRLGVQRCQKRDDVGDVVDDVMHHHDVMLGHLRSGLWPRAEHFVVLNSGRSCALGECLQHRGLAVDGGQ